MRIGFFGAPLLVGVDRRRDEPAGRAAGGAGGGTGGDRCWPGRSVATTPASSIVSTPPTMSAMPSAITHVSGSANRIVRDDRDQRHAARGPHAVGDADRHAQSPASATADRTTRGSRAITGTIQIFLRNPSDARSAKRREHLDEDRAGQRQPHHDSASSDRCDPNSTSSTPAMISPMPATIGQVNGSPKIAAASTAVPAVPSAPQIP